MLKKFIVLITAVGVSVLFANQAETVRESTIIYKLKEDATPAQLKKFNALVKKENIISKKEIKAIKVNVVKLKNIKGLEKAFSKQLMNTGAVKFAEPDASIPHADIPDDSNYTLQWHHPTINSPLAWDHTTGADGLDVVKVCVLDTGVDTDHSDLIGNLFPGHVVPASATDIEDLFGHGTGTSGVIGAVGNNGIGVAGMAWDINIIPVKISMDVDRNGKSSSSAYISDMAVGIIWCADEGGKVANLSYGGAQYATISEAAQDLRDSGGLLFMSAGNDGTYNNINTYPDYTSFVVVGATDRYDDKTSWSEYGPFVDITAPGVSIRTTYLNGSYVYYSGTSFSSPMAAGLAALIYTVKPDFTPAEVESFIFSTAVDLGAAGDDDEYGHGRIDAGAAVVAAVDSLGTQNIPPVAVADSNITSGYAPLTVAFNGSGSTDDDGTIMTYLWNFGDGNTGSGVTATHTYETDGDFNATLTVTDNRGAQTISTPPITIQVDPDPSQISAPTNLSATVEGNNVILKWFDNSSNESGFVIFRAQKYRGKYIYDLTKPLTTTDVNTTTYTDTNVDKGDYRYKIRAKGTYDGEGIDSDFSNEVSVKVETSLPVEPDPGTLSAPVLSASISYLKVSLEWSDVCPDGSTCTYYIERGVGRNINQVSFDLIDTSDGTSYEDSDVDIGTYYYRVYATVEGGDTSDYSNTVTARLK
jgi:PKD repeat protein